MPAVASLTPDVLLRGRDSYKMLEFKDRDKVQVAAAALEAANGVGVAPRCNRDVPPAVQALCVTFLTFWIGGSCGGILCAIVAREGTSGRRPARARRSLRIIRQHCGRPGAFIDYRLNEDPWVAYDTSGFDHKGAKNSTWERNISVSRF